MRIILGALLGLMLAGSAFAQGTGYSSGNFGLSGGNNSWPGGVTTSHNGIPPVSLSTTCAGTITPASSFGFYTVIVTGTGCVIALPTSIAAGDVASFLITEGTGSNLATFASGYDGWLGGTSFTGTASATNYVTCQFTGTTPATVCGPGGLQAGLVAASAAIYSHNISSPCNGGGGTTCTTTLNLTTGSTLVVGTGTCNTASCDATASAISSIGVSAGSLSGCTAFTGANNAVTSNSGFPTIQTINWQYCSVTGTNSSVTVTVTFSGTVYYTGVEAIDITGASGSPDRGIGKITSGGTAITAVSAPSNGSASVGDLCFSGLLYGNTGTLTASGGWAVLDSDGATTFAIMNLAPSGSGTVTAAGTLGTAGIWGADTICVH